jgi:hypothetical protein
MAGERKGSWQVVSGIGQRDELTAKSRPSFPTLSGACGSLPRRPQFKQQERDSNYMAAQRLAVSCAAGSRHGEPAGGTSRTEAKCVWPTDRAELIQHRAPHMLHMQKALTPDEPPAQRRVE